jgi:hypothetical protein
MNVAALAKSHDPQTCPFCLSAVADADHVHCYDSAIGASCFPDAVPGMSTLMLQCACGHTRDFLGIIHPEPAPDQKDVPWLL